MGGETSRSAYVASEHKQFQSSLRRLGVSEGIVVLADLQEFMRDWTCDVPFGELQRQWNYKKIGQVARRAVMQIRLGPGRNYRVALLPISQGDAPTIWFLHAYRRTTTNQDDIERAKERAQNILEQYYV